MSMHSIKRFSGSGAPSRASVGCEFTWRPRLWILNYKTAIGDYHGERQLAVFRFRVSSDIGRRGCSFRLAMAFSIHVFSEAEIWHSSQKFEENHQNWFANFELDLRFGRICGSRFSGKIAAFGNMLLKLRV